ncbi:hypothetical protein D9M71_799940 [compost metagenome]
MPVLATCTSKPWSSEVSTALAAKYSKWMRSSPQPWVLAVLVTKSMKPPGPHTYNWLSAGSAASTAGRSSFCSGAPSSKCKCTLSA